jgi:hypothetical protein
MEHMSTFVREIENDLSHGDNMFSMVFTKESTVLLTGSMVWEGLIVTRGPFNMFQNILTPYTFIIEKVNFIMK